MNRLAPLLGMVAALAGCIPRAPSGPPGAEFVRQLQAPSAEERDAAFQELLRGGLPFLATLKPAMGVGPREGLPVVALLYAMGEGDAVPLELRARHLAAFRWPLAAAAENAVIEPVVRSGIERDVVLTGRPALRILARAIAQDASDEAGAMRVARAMVRIGGRAAGDEFARLLGSDRAVGDVRVCDVAAAALLYLGRQELPLRLAGADARLEAARAWWGRAKDQDESLWIREAVAALAERWMPRDPEGVRPVIERLVGETVEDPAKLKDWAPEPPPLRPEALLPALSGAGAFRANDLLERATGVKVFLPRMERVGELCAALRLWRAPEDLGLLWRRRLEAPFLRLSIAAVGRAPGKDANHVRWAYETVFHATEEDSGELRIDTREGSYSLYVHAREYGTRLVFSEFFSAADQGVGRVLDLSATRPAVAFSSALKSAILISVEEVSGRRPPRLAEAAGEEWRKRLRAWADALPGDEAASFLRALGYFQDGQDLPLMRERKSGEGLLLLGDPAALPLQPRLEPWEIEMALWKAESPAVRAYLRTAPLR